MVLRNNSCLYLTIISKPHFSPCPLQMYAVWPCIGLIENLVIPILPHTSSITLLHTWSLSSITPGPYLTPIPPYKGMAYPPQWTHREPSDPHCRPGGPSEKSGCGSVASNGCKYSYQWRLVVTHPGLGAIQAWLAKSSFKAPFTLEEIPP